MKTKISKIEDCFYEFKENLTDSEKRGKIGNIMFDLEMAIVRLVTVLEDEITDNQVSKKYGEDENIASLTKANMEIEDMMVTKND
jgi:hypothetical protein